MNVPALAPAFTVEEPLADCGEAVEPSAGDAWGKVDKVVLAIGRGVNSLSDEVEVAGVFLWEAAAEDEEDEWTSPDPAG